MNHSPLESTHISSCGYDPESRTLEVTFHRGGTYVYPDVSPEEHHAMATAYSPGDVFHRTIRRKGGSPVTAPGR